MQQRRKSLSTSTGCWTLIVGLLVVIMMRWSQGGESSLRRRPGAFEKVEGGMSHWAASAKPLSLKEVEQIKALAHPDSGMHSALCKEPPAQVWLPLSQAALDQDPVDMASFARFKLVPGVSLAVQGVERAFSMYVYAENDVVGYWLQRTKTWEQGWVVGVIEQLQRFAKERGLRPEEVTFVDVGANVGTFALPAAAHGFSVVAVEAMQSNQLALQLSLCANPGLRERMRIVGKGVGSEATNCTLFSLSSNMGDGTLRCGSSFTAPPGGVKRATLDIVRLDDLFREDVPQLRGRVGAMKMDIEGGEPLAVEGGPEFFREVAPPFVVAECDEPMIRAVAGQPAGSFLRQMWDMGYRVYRDHGPSRTQHLEIPEELLEGYRNCSYAQVWFKKRGVGGERAL